MSMLNKESDDVSAPTEIEVARLALAYLPGVGAKGVLKSFSSPATSMDDVRGFAETLTHRDVAAEYETALSEAWRVVNESLSHGIRILAYDNPDYPEPLRNIPDPPPFLYVRGRLPKWNLAVAVIGTRDPDDAALNATRAIVECLSDEPSAVVVSGLALGIDSEAHREALSVNTRTVAVLANGLDSVYPKRNEKLAEEILERGGALVSELPVGSRVVPYNLVARDRLQSGLSKATMLVQSSLDGGSMHTARFTLEQGRTLIVLRPLGEGHSWSGNVFLTARAESIDWPTVPDRLQRFQRLAQGSARLAVPMLEANIPELIARGMKVGFVAQQVRPDREPENLALGLKL
jgi:DNA protecting protein DprA